MGTQGERYNVAHNQERTDAPQGTVRREWISDHHLKEGQVCRDGNHCRDTHTQERGLLEGLLMQITINNKFLTGSEIKVCLEYIIEEIRFMDSTEGYCGDILHNGEIVGEWTG